MTDDPRCCGSGTCIIDPDGRCWCGQVWDGEKMSTPRRETAAEAAIGEPAAKTAEADASRATGPTTSR